MKTNGLKTMWKIIIATGGALLMVTSVYGSGETDAVVQEARLKTAKGDLEGATALYQQAMRNEPENTGIRSELAKVLVEANVREPHTDSLEVIDVIEKGTKVLED